MAKDKQHSGSSGRGRRARSPRSSKSSQSYQSRRGKRSEPDSTPAAGESRRRDLRGDAADLPNWVVRDLERVTPAERAGPALAALGSASAALAEGRHHAAVKHGSSAKELAPRDATVRETIGIAAYRIGDWKTALAELRAYRRLSGDTTHLPVEMDVLRAQGRDADVDKAWRTLKELGGRPAVMKEGAVVYASFLLDAGRPDDAWRLTKPKALSANTTESTLRVWYVAARAAVQRGNADEARRISDAILRSDPGFPGIEELDREITGAV